MIWRSGDRYFIESDAGYTIGKVSLDGEIRYEAWGPKRAPDAPLNFIGSYPSADQAKTACAAHFDLDQSR